MGLCPSNSTPENDAINRQMEQDYMNARRLTKLLLLGTGNAGKSTFFRQFQRLYGKGIADDERRNYMEQIQSQCVDQMKILADQCIKRSQAGNHELELSPPALEAFTNLQQGPEKILNATIAEYIRILWCDKGIKAGFELRAKMCVSDTSEYFWNEIQRIGSPEFSPTDDDIVYLRAPTNGITQVDFMMEGQKFGIVDVGGQRSERKKWFNVFSDVTGILWVASLSSYDEVLFEDHDANAMHEQLRVFTETINLPTFQQTPVMLFLNKSDLFEKKLLMTPLNTCFPEYAGSNGFDDAVDFLKAEFKSRDECSGRDIYLHVTCATDQTSVSKVFSDVTHTIVHRSLADARIL